MIGVNLGTSVMAIPALLHAPAPVLATQWKILFDNGVIPVVFLALSSSAGFAALALQSTLRSTTSTFLQRNLYIAASITAFGLVPYTKILMWGNITELEKRAQTTSRRKEKDDTHDLVKTWSSFNFWRGIMLLSSGVAGIWASVS
jgi:formate-dependent nitrite reductase membrane component NrfD